MKHDTHQPPSQATPPELSDDLSTQALTNATGSAPEEIFPQQVTGRYPVSIEKTGRTFLDGVWSVNTYRWIGERARKDAPLEID